MTVPLQQGELFRVLLHHRVEFLVIGAAAVAVHGFSRGTKDLDVVPGPSLDNLQRLHDALVELEARPIDIDDFEANEFPELTVQNLAGGGSWCLVTKHGRLDVLQYVAEVLETAEDFARLTANAVDVGIPDGTLRIIGFDDLIAFKHAAGRPQDLVDIRALYEARGDTGPR